VPLGFYGTTSVGQVINSIMFEVQQIIDMIKNVITTLIPRHADGGWPDGVSVVAELAPEP